MFPPSAESLVTQNMWIDLYGLHRYQDDQDLARAVKVQELVPIIESPALTVSPSLPPNRRYIRPWVQSFLDEVSQAYYEEFGEPLVITSAVRTVKVQRSLLHWNRNAAPAHGDRASSHLAGSTIDIARRNMTPEQNRWMEFVLQGYALNDLILAEEETGQMCFHIFVMPDTQYVHETRPQSQ